MEMTQLMLFREVIEESNLSVMESFQSFEYFLLSNLTLVMFVLSLLSDKFPHVCFPVKIISIHFFCIVGKKYPFPAVIFRVISAWVIPSMEFASSCLKMIAVLSRGLCSHFKSQFKLFFLYGLSHVSN